MSDVGLGCIVISFILCFKGYTFLQNHVDFPSKLFSRQHQYDGAESGSYFDRTQEGKKKKKGPSQFKFGRFLAIKIQEH